MTRGLIIIAHGSRRQESNDEVRDFGSALAARLGPRRYQLYVTAFLELAEPSIPEAVRQCLAAGCREIHILPYFLSTGRHVHEDVPRLAREGLGDATATLTFLPYVGADLRLLDVAQAIVEGA